MNPVPVARAKSTNIVTVNLIEVVTPDLHFLNQRGIKI